MERQKDPSTALGASNNKELYQCPECGFWYKEKEWSEKCEAWCKKYKSCNLKITKHSIKELK